MLEVDLKGLTTTEFQGRQGQKLFAVFSFRYDAMLVPALKENLWPIVDGFVSWDDRHATGIFSSEGERRKKLIEEARKLGADWILGIDPDERLETSAAEKIRACMRLKPAIWELKCRELYEADKYRSDGIWNNKRIQRLFPATKTMVFDYDALHSQFPPIYPVLPVRQADINLYHLKMMDPARRTARRDLYNVLDPEGAFQAIGYDYLADERNLELTQIEPARRYLPAHEETGGLWMADVSAPQPRSVDAGQSDDIPSSVEPECAITLQAAADSLAYEGRDAERVSLLTSKAGEVEFDTRIMQLRFQPPLGTTTTESCFHEQGWTQGEVTISWGRLAKPFEAIAAIAIGLGAPDELREAVSSLLSQTEPVSVIVVNSGGGDLHAVLGDLSEKVIAVSVPERVYVGAARNIGVYLSNATWMSFLAGDCTANPEWIAERLKMHRAGHAAVSSPVVNSDPNSAVAWAYHLSLYMLRLPDTPEMYRIDYGLSLDRHLIERAGYYDPSLRVMEDTILKGRIAALGKIGSAAGALTVHKARTRPLHAFGELVARRRRAARLTPTLGTRSLEPKFGRPWIALRSAMRRALVLKSKTLTRCRRGLPAPERKSAFNLGVRLMPVFSMADIVGLLMEFPQELRDRMRAQRILALLQTGDTDRAKILVGQWTGTIRLGELAARELASELARAGLAAEGLKVLQHISRVYALSSYVKRLERAIQQGRFEGI